MLRSLSVISAISLFSAIFPFLLLPIITRWTSVEEYGHLIVLETFIVLITPFIHFAISGVVVEFFKLSKKDFSGYVTNALLLAFPVFILMEVGVLLMGDSLAILFDIDARWLKVLPVFVMFNVITLVLASIYQCQKNYMGYAGMLIGPSFLSFLVTVILLVCFEWGWESKLYATGFSSILFAFIALYFMNKGGYLIKKVSKRFVKLNLAFTLPLIPHSVAAGMYFVADRLFLSEVMGNTSVALYAAGMQLALVMSVLQNALSRAWVPHVLGLMRNCGNTYLDVSVAYKNLSKQMVYAAMLVLVISFMLILGIELAVGFILPEGYEESKYIGMLLVGGFGLLGFYKIVSPVLWHHKRSASLSTVTILVFCINLFLNAILIPMYGVYGACYATVISMGCQFVFTLLLVVNISSNHLNEINDAR